MSQFLQLTKTYVSISVLFVKYCYSAMTKIFCKIATKSINYNMKRNKVYKQRKSTSKINVSRKITRAHPGKKSVTISRKCIKKYTYKQCKT